VAILLALTPARAGVLIVAQSGGNFTTVQAALDVAAAGDTIQVRENSTYYNEKIAFPRSGSALDGFITLEAASGESPILDARGLSDPEHVVTIENRSYVRLEGFEIRNNTDGYGVRAEGAGSHIELRANRIHATMGSDAGGISVYGTATQPISDLVIDGNEIYDNEPAHSEALVLNGNVADFEVTNNIVRDNNNIGIDFIGGETDIQPDTTLVARDGVCRGNLVSRANSNYDGGFGAGIYVDGGRDIVIENNVVTGSDMGIEVGAENAGVVTTGILVRNNVLFENEKAGIVFGGFEESVGRANGNHFTGNTLYHNNTLGEEGQGVYFAGNGLGEFYVQYSSGNTIENNIVYAGEHNVFFAFDEADASVSNGFDYNLYFSDDVESGVFVMNDVEYTGFSSWRASSGQDAHSLAGDPLLLDAGAGDFHLGSASPAVDRGNPGFTPEAGESDLDGGARLRGVAVDIGVDELPEPGGTAGALAVFATLCALARRRRSTA